MEQVGSGVHTSPHWKGHTQQQRGGGLQGQWTSLGFALGINHIQGCSLSDPWAEDEIQQPSVPLGGVLVQCVQIENINVVTPSISGQRLNTFLIKNASYINAQADVNLDLEPLCIKFQVALE